MGVTNKDIKKALYRLKQDGRTPIEVINHIKERCGDGYTPKINNHDYCDEVTLSKPFERILDVFPLLRGWENLPRISENQFYDIVVLTLTGNKLAAVKELKICSGFGLKESKDIIDYFEKIRGELVFEVKKRYKGQNLNFN